MKAVLKKHRMRLRNGFYWLGVSSTEWLSRTWYSLEVSTQCMEFLNQANSYQFCYRAKAQQVNSVKTSQ
jgi:hypothetical protein